MEGVKTKAQSQGQDSQITSENVEGFQERVKEILNLIKEDENSSEMTVEIKKSKLTKLVTELSSMYDPDVLLKKISTLEKEVTELNLVVSKANRKIETMGKVIEGSRKQVITRDEVNLKLQQELSSKVFNLNQKIYALGKQLDEAEAQKLELEEKVSSGVAEITNQDDQIMEMSADIEWLNTELKEKCQLVDALKQKHDVNG